MDTRLIITPCNFFLPENSEGSPCCGIFNIYKRETLTNLVPEKKENTYNYPCMLWTVFDLVAIHCA
jgi:hypothetical protein